MLGCPSRGAHDMGMRQLGELLQRIAIERGVDPAAARAVSGLLLRPWSELTAAHWESEYAESQWLSRAALDAVVAAKLRRLVWFCMLRVPAYAPVRERLAADLSGLEIAGLPICAGSCTGDHQAHADEDPSIPEGELVRLAAEAEARRTAIARRSRSWGAPAARWWTLEGVGVVAAPCSGRDDAPVHVHGDHVIVECVDDADPPCPTGSSGRLLVTDLHERKRPRLRWDTGRRGRVVDRPCRCGRALPVLVLDELGSPQPTGDRP